MWQRPLIVLCLLSTLVVGRTQQAPRAPPIVFSSDGAWCWFQDPRAVHVRGLHDRVYAAWVTSKGALQVGAWDRLTGRIETTTLKDHWEIDDHDSPSFLVLPDRRLMVFYTRHNRIGLYTRTTAEPEDIRSWGPEIVIAGTQKITYSHPVYLADEKRMYVFWRGESWKPTFSTSLDGSTWTTPRVLVEEEDSGTDIARPYFKIASDGKSEIHITFTDGHPRDDRLNSIHYLEYRSGFFYKANGTRIGSIDTLPVRQRDCDLVYDARRSRVRAWVWDIALDASGNPVIAYARFPKESAHYYHYARWLGDRWLDTALVAAGGWFPQTPAGTKEREPHYSGGIALDHDDPSIVYLSRQVKGMFEIERWATPDRGMTWTSKPITRDSTEPNVRPVLARNVGASGEVLLWMRGDYVYWTDYHTRIMLLEASLDAR